MAPQFVGQHCRHPLWACCPAKHWLREPAASCPNFTGKRNPSLPVWQCRCQPGPLPSPILQASLASGLVDVCLIPEVSFELEGEHGLFAYLEKVLQDRGHAIVCISEGAGQVRIIPFPSLPFLHKTPPVERVLAAGRSPQAWLQLKRAGSRTASSGLVATCGAHHGPAGRCSCMRAPQCSAPSQTTQLAAAH